MGCSSERQRASGIFSMPLGCWILISTANLKPYFCRPAPLSSTVCPEHRALRNQKGARTAGKWARKGCTRDSDCCPLSTFSLLGILTRVDFSELGLGMELRGRMSETWISEEQEPETKWRSAKKVRWDGRKRQGGKAQSDLLKWMDPGHLYQTCGLAGRGEGHCLVWTWV